MKDLPADGLLALLRDALPGDCRQGDFFADQPRAECGGRANRGLIGYSVLGFSGKAVTFGSNVLAPWKATLSVFQSG